MRVYHPYIHNSNRNVTNSDTNKAAAVFSSHRSIFLRLDWWWVSLYCISFLLSFSLLLLIFVDLCVAVSVNGGRKGGGEEKAMRSDWTEKLNSSQPSCCYCCFALYSDNSSPFFSICSFRTTTMNSLTPLMSSEAKKRVEGILNNITNLCIRRAKIEILQEEKRKYWWVIIQNACHTYVWNNQ